MPTYGYRCTACGHEFERVQKMSDAPLTECEVCGGAVKKILYPVGIAFKGSGFYVNDSRNSGSAPAKKAESAPETPAATESKPETATKPEAGAESKPAAT